MAVQTEATNTVPTHDDMPIVLKSLSITQNKAETLLTQATEVIQDSSLAISDDTPKSSTVIDLMALKGKKLEEAIFNLVSDMFPEWIKGVSSLTIDRVSGALTNAVFFVTANENKRLLLRVYGIGCDQIINRQNELTWIARLSRLNLGPRLLGTFGNGRFEEYLPSTTLLPSDIRDAAISEQIAGRLCQLHDIILEYPWSPSTPLRIWYNVDQWFPTTKLILPELLKKRPDNAALKALDLDRLGRQIEAAKSILSKVNSPIVFAHNDTQYGNILKLQETGELVVVDFEYSGYNPRGYDIANHFCEWMYNYHGDTPASLDSDKYPTYEEQKRFLQAYLEACNDGTTLEQLFYETEIWRMAVHLKWGLWGLLQAPQSEIDFDYVLYGMERIAAFESDLSRWS